MNTLKLVLLISLIFVSFYTGCKRLDNSISDNSNEQIDPVIEGYWYRIDTIYNSNRPPIRISGFIITGKGLMFPLAVETSTGKIAEYQIISPDTINAKDGQFIIKRRNIDYGFRLDTGTYQISSNKLVMNYKYFSYTYNKTQIGSIVTDPIISEMSALINNEVFTNGKISASPSAYASLSITDTISTLTLSCSPIEIKINNYIGAGQYSLGGMSRNIGYWIYFGGDFFMYYSTTAEDTGIITIQSLDMDNKRCNGTFEYTAIYYDSYANIKLVKAIKNGTFNVPVYQ